MDFGVERAKVGKSADFGGTIRLTDHPNGVVRTVFVTGSLEIDSGGLRFGIEDYEPDDDAIELSSLGRLGSVSFE